jgi:hypothetical protein
MSMMMGAMFKRGKRTLRNIEENLVRPLIQKTAWRYMQFQPQRYPMADYRFSVYSGLGASAREFEIAQLSQFLQTMEPGSPEYWVIVRAMLNNFSLDAKDTLLGFVDQRLEAAQNPQPPQPTIDQQIEMQKLQLEQMKVESEILDKRAKLQLKAEETDAEAARDRGEAQWSESTAIANIEKMAAEINKLEAEAEERRAAAKKHLREVSSGGE